MLPNDYIEHGDFISALPRPILAVVQCHSCGYEPPRPDRPPTQCPKCYSGAWERFIWRGKLQDAGSNDARASVLTAMSARRHN
jgi:hypothetical protein